jgi:hypothetical protein
MIAAMAPDDFPGRLAIAPYPLAKHRIADLRSELQLALEPGQAFVGQAVVSADAGSVLSGTHGSFYLAGGPNDRAGFPASSVAGVQN